MGRVETNQPARGEPRITPSSQARINHVVGYLDARSTRIQTTGHRDPDVNAAHQGAFTANESTTGRITILTLRRGELTLRPHR